MKHQDLFLQAIKCKYLGPTNFRGSRIVVTAAAGRMTFGWRSELNSEDNYREAALAFAEAKGWTERTQYIGGVTKEGEWVFVGIPKDKKSLHNVRKNQTKTVYTDKVRW